MMPAKCHNVFLKVGGGGCVIKGLDADLVRRHLRRAVE
jgi:hypothetical protein